MGIERHILSVSLSSCSPAALVNLVRTELNIHWCAILTMHRFSRYLGLPGQRGLKGIADKA